MNTLERGSKHLCPDCSTKYYDLMKTNFTCPNCGAKPPAAKVRRTPSTAKTAKTKTFMRYR